jgi:hypothetical protein
METARSVWRASTGLVQDKRLRHPARAAARASTGLLQEKPLKDRARRAARASTGREQEDPLKHRARPVPRARARLLRAVLEAPALATQATVVTPAQGHAQRA